MKIGELAAKTNVSRDTIRLYERMGILGSVSRPYEYNNYKEYGEENVERIKMVKHMQKLGFTLKETKGMILSIENDSFDENKESFVEKKLIEIDKKIKELLAVKDALKKMLARQCTSEDKARGEKIKTREEIIH